MTPAPWGGHTRTHAHNHITRAGIRKPWTAVSALSLGFIIMAKPILASLSIGYAMLMRANRAEIADTYPSNMVVRMRIG